MSRYSSRISLSDRLSNAKSEIEDGQARFSDIVRYALYIQDEAKKANPSWEEIAAAAKDIEDAIGGNY